MHRVPETMVTPSSSFDTILFMMLSVHGVPDERKCNMCCLLGGASRACSGSAAVIQKSYSLINASEQTSEPLPKTAPRVLLAATGIAAHGHAKGASLDRGLKL